MPYESRLFAQDASTGRVDQTLAALELAASVPFQSVDAAIAYATLRGVSLFNQRLCQVAPQWAGATKRFLISIDYGITDPGALAALGKLPGFEVRVPNGLAVLANRWLRPKVTFHTKAYAFRGESRATPLGLVTGSANLSVSALAVGAEASAVQLWTGRLANAEQVSLAAAMPLLDWFEDAWAAADPLSAVLPPYRLRRRRPLLAGPGPLDDRTPAVTAYLAEPSTVEVHGPLAVQLASAKVLWVKTDAMYANRGGGVPGNQLDMPRGTRVYFGFDAANVPKNTKFGEVMIQATGHAAVSRTVKFANNSMDKINLPLPGRHGPPSYDDAYLIFQRERDGAGVQVYRLAATDAAGLARRKAQAAHTVDLEMHGGRPYGLMF